MDAVCFVLIYFSNSNISFGIFFILIIVSIEECSKLGLCNFL